MNEETLNEDNSVREQRRRTFAEPNANKASTTKTGSSSASTSVNSSTSNQIENAAAGMQTSSICDKCNRYPKYKIGICAIYCLPATHSMHAGLSSAGSSSGGGISAMSSSSSTSSHNSSSVSSTSQASSSSNSSTNKNGHQQHQTDVGNDKKTCSNVLSMHLHWQCLIFDS